MSVAGLDQRDQAMEVGQCRLGGWCNDLEGLFQCYEDDDRDDG